MKKSTAILWIAVSGIIAVVFCILFISGTIRKDAEIEELKGNMVSQAAQILELDADNTEKDSRIGDLSAEAEGHAARIEELNQEIAEKDAAMEQQESELEELAGRAVSQQNEIAALTEEKNTYSKNAETAAEEVKNLQTEVSDRTKELESVTADNNEKAEQIRQVESQIASQQASIEQYEAQLASRNSAISALESQVAAEKALLEEQNRRHFGGGQFTWPCPGYSRISDDYGYRTHPIYGDQRFHSGLDLAASTGTPILAAADGDVVAAAYEASMGNYIMIDHGDSLYTIYMHCSALYVSKGQSVSAGQKIGAVGSTGNSTGPHLHFSVRLNGKYVSPWNYL